MFPRNESTLDRIIRAVVGAILTWAGYWPLGGQSGSILGIVALLVGLILLVTAATGFCLLYRLLGISTYKR